MTLYLVDISSFIFRAFFAIRSLSNRAGEPTNAVYGVATMLARLMEEARPERLAIVYDSKEPSFRKEVYPEYKANRSAAPDDLIPQFDKIEELVQCLGMHSYRRSGAEADDIIATLTQKWCKASPDNKVVIVTGDKDLMQLVDNQVMVWDTMNNARYGPAEVEAKFGVKPTQIRDYLALIGDSSDNIPGVPSIGPKTAVGLLQEHGDLESVLKAAADGKISGKKGEVLKTHVEDARLSARLASLEMNLPDEPDAQHTQYQFQISERCVSFLQRMDFHSLVAKWGKYTGGGEAKLEPAPPASRAAPSDEMPRPSITQLTAGADQFRMVNTEKEFQKLLESMERKGEFGFDLETTSLNPRQAVLVGAAICHDPSYGVYIPVGHRGTQVAQLPEKRVLDGLKPFLESTRLKKIGQNLKYDWSVLLAHGIRPAGIGADTMVAAYVLEPENRHNLEALAAQYLNYTVTTYEQICGKGKDQLCFDQIPVDVATRYSGEDAWVAVKLWDELRPRIDREGLGDIFTKVDLPLVGILARMESQGVSIDEPWLKAMSKEFEKELRAIEERIQAFTQGPINLNSPKQLGKLLFEDLKLPVQSKTKTGYSTDASVLDALAPLHEVPRLLLEYREITKLKGTYVDPLPLMRDAKTGKIHATFNQTVAATGRLSSSDPNLQNIPIRSERGLKIRRGFVASPGNCLVSADYSQIELRLLAHMSQDKELVGSFQKDEDVHTRTASEIFNVDPKSVDERQRGIAKAINFGLMYGKTAFGLAQELKIPRREAQDIINRYFERYNGVKRFLDGQIIQAKEKGFITTLMGRKRNLPDIRSSNPAIRNNAERMAMNSPIQGTAADLMKLAMIELDRALEQGGFQSKLIIQVHDEVVLDCPKKEAPEVRKLLETVMENAMSISVPLRVNSATADNWMDL
jgi:DNA polymerase I